MQTSRVYASIITIGDELLIGQTIDTNSAWMAQQLNKMGIWVRRRVAVGDVWQEIWDALDEESTKADLIFITGGLGPTSDDITKPLLCKYFNGKMVVNEAALANVHYIFEQYLKRPIIEVNLKQAEVPDVCKVIVNKRGTAPGMWFTKNNRQYISMPGVPHEMKGMMTDTVLPELPGLFNLPVVYHRTLLVAGIGESFLAERIKDFETALPAHIKLAYLPNYSLVRLRLTGTGNAGESIAAEVDTFFKTLAQQLQDVLVINEDRSMEEVIGLLLKKYKATVSLAESCTGGYIAHLLTSIAGSSSYFIGGVVSYDNSIKENIVGVNADTLDNYGAVSEETVWQMANGIRQKMDTDYGLAVSGIMGPAGGSEDKPVGTVWIAAAGKSKTITRKFHFRFDRKRNTDMTAVHAMNLLRTLIVAENQ